MPVTILLLCARPRKHQHQTSLLLFFPSPNFTGCDTCFLSGQTAMVSRVSSDLPPCCCIENAPALTMPKPRCRCFRVRVCVCPGRLGNHFAIASRFLAVGYCCKAKMVSSDWWRRAYSRAPSSPLLRGISAFPFGFMWWGVFRFSLIRSVCSAASALQDKPRAGPPPSSALCVR